MDKFPDYRPHKLQRLFHESKRQIYISGRYAGKNYAEAQIAKEFPKSKMLVPDLRQMDIMISLGVKPSQIILSPGEFPKSEILEYYASVLYPKGNFEDGGNQ